MLLPQRLRVRIAPLASIGGQHQLLRTVPDLLVRVVRLLSTRRDAHQLDPAALRTCLLLPVQSPVSDDRVAFRPRNNLAVRRPRASESDWRLGALQAGHGSLVAIVQELVGELILIMLYVLGRDLTSQLPRWPNTPLVARVLVFAAVSILLCR